MRARSNKRAVQERLYLLLRAIFLREHPRCERCGGKATEVHHKAGREGWLLCFIEHFMAVCRGCHVYIEAHGREAKERGWKYEVTNYDRNQVEQQARELIAANKGG